MTMIRVSPYITNTLFMLVCIMSALQHYRHDRPNPVTNVQFAMIVFGMLMVLVVALCNDINPWLSPAFLAIAVASLIFTIRQQRMLPPRKRFE
jgi:disulfide bond formation protein DsbB